MQNSLEFDFSYFFIFIMNLFYEKKMNLLIDAY